jgi:hypothetical protein
MPATKAQALIKELVIHHAGIRSLTSKLCSVSPSGTSSRSQPMSPVPPKHIRTLQCARRRANDQSQDLRLVSLGARQNTSPRSPRWSERSGGLRAGLSE